MKDLMFFKMNNPRLIADKLCIKFRSDELEDPKNSSDWVDILHEASNMFGKMMKISLDWTDLYHSPFDIREIPTECR
jgi:hypothetical protein